MKFSMENLKLASLEDGKLCLSFQLVKKKELIVAEMLVEEADNAATAMADDKRSKRMKRSKVNRNVFDIPASNEFSQEKVFSNTFQRKYYKFLCCRVYSWSIKSLIPGT